MHALIIEPEALVSALIENVLRKTGYFSFAFATTQERAVIEGRRRYPDLIVAEVELKLGCGIQAAEAICAHRSIPLVFMSETRRAAPGHFPAAATVQKPLLASALTQAVFQARALQAASAGARSGVRMTGLAKAIRTT